MILVPMEYLANKYEDYRPCKEMENAVLRPCRQLDQFGQYVCVLRELEPALTDKTFDFQSCGTSIAVVNLPPYSLV